MGVGIDEIVTFTKGALSPVGGTLSDVWAGLIGDKVAAWRLKNAMATQRAVFEEAKIAGLTINASKVPERYAFSWFEEASKQDEPEIQMLFARLLLRASEGDENALDRRHIATLSQFTPIDALTFEFLFLSVRTDKNFGSRLPRWDHELNARQASLKYGELAVASIEHLINLGVLARGFQLKSEAGRNDLRGHDTRAINRITVKNEFIAAALGMSLHLAIRKVPNANPPASTPH